MQTAANSGKPAAAHAAVNSTTRDMLFISHASPEDDEFARWLALQLAKEGYPVWCDRTKLLGGEPFWEEIEAAIRNRTRRFLFVQSRDSNKKEGPLDEVNLARTMRRQLDDEHFIVALRIDHLPFSDVNIRLHKLNSIDFSTNWMSGFVQLIKRLEEDGIQKSDKFGKDAVAIWWRQHFGEDEGVREATDYYLSNRLELSRLPPSINIIKLEGPISDDVDISKAPFPLSRHGKLVVSFALFRDLLPFFEALRIGNDGTDTEETSHFLDKGYLPVIDGKSARNHVRFLLRQGFNNLAAQRGLREYSLTGRRRFFWFPQNLVENDRISYRGADGVASWKQIVGFQSLKAKDGYVPIRNWHFGVEAVPRVGFETFIALLPHVVFSEDGHVYESTKKQHACRRRQCRRWYNNDWRDRILATLHFVQDKRDELRIPLAPESFATFKAEPTVFESPVTYTRTVDIEEPIEHELEEHPEAEIEDEGDEDEL
jgi:hypothetical protein